MATTRAMYPLALILVASLPSPEPESAAEVPLEGRSPPARSAPASARSWLPTVTLRLTHRGRAAAWTEADPEGALTPWGTTFQVVLEWSSGGAASGRGAWEVAP